MRFSKDILTKNGRSFLFIYLLSYEIYILVNNLIANLTNYFLRGEFYLNLFNGHHAPCTDTETLIYVVASFILKLTIFLFLLVKLYKQPHESLPYYLDFFIAYFLYDLAAFFALVIDAIELINIRFYDYFYSNPEIIFDSYIRNSVLFFSTFWSVSLLVLLKKQKILSTEFLAKRLLFIPFSMLLFLLIIQMVM